MLTQMKFTYTLDNLPEVANQVLREASSKNLMFYGDMGVGKTTLIKEIAKQLGVVDALSSPTFSIINEYPLEGGNLYHFDFYRINSYVEALDIGLEEYFKFGNWSLVEWPEKIECYLPTDRTNIKITINSNGSRTINILPVI